MFLPHNTISCGFRLKKNTLVCNKCYIRYLVLFIPGSAVYQLNVLQKNMYSEKSSFAR